MNSIIKVDTVVPPIIPRENVYQNEYISAFITNGRKPAVVINAVINIGRSL